MQKGAHDNILLFTLRRRKINLHIRTIFHIGQAIGDTHSSFLACYFLLYIMALIMSFDFHFKLYPSFST